MRPLASSTSPPPISSSFRRVPSSYPKSDARMPADAARRRSRKPRRRRGPTDGGPVVVRAVRAAHPDTPGIDTSVRARAPLIAALCFVVSVAYGALFYGFSVLVTEPAAGGEFSRGLLSAAYGGAVLTGGLAAIPVGRLADRYGVRVLIAVGAIF